MRQSFSAPAPKTAPKKMAVPHAAAKAAPSAPAAKAPTPVKPVAPDPLMKNMGSVQPPYGMPATKVKKVKYR